VNCALTVVGQAILDVPISAPDGSARLGGVCHAARGAVAAGANTTILYVAPTWVIEHVLAAFGTAAIKIGDVAGAPSTILIGDSTEAGPQNYEQLLIGSQRITVESEIPDIVTDGDGPILFIGDEAWQRPLIHAALGAQRPVWVDSIGCEILDDLGADDLAGLLVSTSQPAWITRFEGDPHRLFSLCGTSAQDVVLKENRGGSRAVTSAQPDVIASAGAYVSDTRHSVGVGDVFDAVYVASRTCGHDLERSLSRAAAAAAAYARTDEDQPADAAMHAALARIDRGEIGRGLRVPWELRPSILIYLAAPDFPDVDTKPLDALQTALRYHNFAPHRPIQENGLVGPDADPVTRARAAAADIDLLEQCQVIVAVDLSDDPGTWMEVGFAVAQGRRTITYDPYGRTMNPMITEFSVTRRSLDAVISAVFEAADALLAV
jgi:nucleoside 2-deoxyribosyltransferase